MLSSKNKYTVDKNGYYGIYGGAYVPEMLYNNIEELQKNYKNIITQREFQILYNDLLHNYVGRPSPLYFSKYLSDKHKTQIYLKREDLNYTGSHKINNTIGQVLIAESLGKTRIIAETGAGQHGVATATACAIRKIPCTIYMGYKDMQRQASNVMKIKMLGADIIPVKNGSQTLKDAINEAIRDWIINSKNTHYLIGSVVGPHPFPDMVSLFQSIISKEIQEQISTYMPSKKPSHIIACVGGGSNAAGSFYNFLDDEDVKLIGIEAAGHGIRSNKTAASIASGSVGIIHGSMTKTLQTHDGQIQETHSISAGLDYPGIGPLHAYLYETKRATYLNVTDKEAMNAGFELMRHEGILTAIESAHAIAGLNKLSFEKDHIVVLILSGSGNKDLDTYLNDFKDE